MLRRTLLRRASGVLVASAALAAVEPLEQIRRFWSGHSVARDGVIAGRDAIVYSREWYPNMDFYVRRDDLLESAHRYYSGTQEGRSRIVAWKSLPMDNVQVDFTIDPPLQFGTIPLPLLKYDVHPMPVRVGGSEYVKLTAIPKHLDGDR